MKINKFVAGMLSALLITGTATIIPANSAEIISSGKCGDNATWTLDSEGTFTVSGSGAMKSAYWHSISVGEDDCLIDWGEYTPHEWYEQRDKIKRVVIEEGVTNVGFSTFIDCDNLESISLPDTLQVIDEFSFMHCDRLTKVILPKASMLITKYSFAYCDNLESVAVAAGTLRISEGAFAYNEKLSEVKIYSGNCLIDETTSIISNSSDGVFNGIMYGYEGSTAQAYAEKYGITFKNIESLEIADVDMDGSINALDASMALTEYAMTATGKGSVLYDYQEAFANVNGDSAVNALDASVILSYYAYTATGGEGSLEDFLNK